MLTRGSIVFKLHAVNDAAPDPGVRSRTTADVVALAQPKITHFALEALDRRRVKLYWTVSASTTELEVLYASSRGVESRKLNPQGSPYTLIDSNLQPRETDFTLRASNVLTTDEDTKKVLVAEIAPPIIVPGSFEAVPIGQNAVRLEWELGGGAPTSLRVVYTDSDGTEESEVINPTHRSYTLTLPSSGLYRLSLIAVNSATDSDGVSAGSQLSTSWLLSNRRSQTSPPCRSTGTKSGWTGCSAAVLPTLLTLSYTGGSDEIAPLATTPAGKRIPRGSPPWDRAISTSR